MLRRKEKESPPKPRVVVEVAADTSQAVAEVEAMAKAVRALSDEIERLERVARSRLEGPTWKNMLRDVVRRVMGLGQNAHKGLCYEEDGDHPIREMMDGEAGSV